MSSPDAQPKILVYGSRIFGQVVKDLALQCGYDFGGFVDDVHQGADVLGSWGEVAPGLDRKIWSIAVAVGYRHLEERHRICERLVADGYHAPALIHPRAYVRNRELVAQGAFIMAGATLDLESSVGAFSVIWPGVALSHHSRIGSNTFVSPNATICGKTIVGDNCFIGAGATVVDHQNVPDNSFIKAGAVYARAP